MSTLEGVLPRPYGKSLSNTERNWLLGLAVAIGLVAVFTLIGWLESRGQDDRRARLVWNASETSTRFLAIAHTVVATSFLLSSKRMKGAKGWGWFLSLTAAGVGACFAYAALGGKHHPLAEFLFYAYFLAHEVRDELFFYRVNGDVPAGDDPAAATRGLWLAPLLVSGAIAATFLAGAAFGIGGARRYAAALDGVAQPGRIALGVAVIVATFALLLVVQRRYAKSHPGGWRGLLSHHRPIFVVFGLIYALLMVGVAATGRMYAIVAVHVSIWYVFSLKQLASRPAPSPRPRALSWAWVRSTTAGFNVFHLGVMALVVGAAAYRAFALENAAEPHALAILVSKESFPYWTLMHVTWSWVPRS